MPCVPMDIPSDTVMVLKRTPLHPEASIEFSTRSANSLMCMLQGVTFDQVDAMPTNGFEKSAVSKPTPLSIDRDAA